MSGPVVKINQTAGKLFPSLPRRSKMRRRKSIGLFERSQTNCGQNNRVLMRMSRLTKIMLGLMIVNAVASVLITANIVNDSKFPGLDVVFPLTAVFYGMFMICRMLQKDIAEFDAEQRSHHDHASPHIHSQSVESFHNHGHHESMRA
jgi:ABC-type nickel/cobalt efflux system permease component RcnA